MRRQMSGIYKIENNLNGKIYIGQTQNVFKRRAEHFIALRRGRHPNQEMQRDWNLNNRGFRFDVVEYCALTQLNEREKYWIDKFNSMAPRGYNLDWVPYKRKKKTTGYKQKRYHKTR